MINYYIAMNQDINKDKKKEDLILKYRDDKFLVALPIKNFIEINKYFSSSPKIPKKYKAVYTYRDYNKDKVKDHILHLFTLNGKYILSLPINKYNPKNKIIDGYKNDKQPELLGGYKNDKQPELQSIEFKDQTDFAQYIKQGAGLNFGFIISDALSDAFTNIFE